MKISDRQLKRLEYLAFWLFVLGAILIGVTK